MRRLALPSVLVTVTLSITVASCAPTVTPADGGGDAVSADDADDTFATDAMSDTALASDTNTNDTGDTNCPCDSTCRYTNNEIVCSRADGSPCRPPPGCALA